MLHCPVEYSLWDIVRIHHVLRRCYIAPHGQWAAGCFRRAACWRVSLCSQKIQAWWWAGHWWTRQDGEFQPVMDKPLHASCDPSMLPDHRQNMLDLTSENLDSVQRSQLANMLIQFADLFPVPGSALTGHTDAVEHTIDTGATAPIRCAPRRMSPQKIKKEEACVTEMLTGGRIEPSDSPWSAPVVLVTKKDDRTRFCVDYIAG